MRGAVLHAPGDVRVEDRPQPTIEQPTDAIIRLAAAINEADADHDVVHWLTPVTDEEYAAAPAVD